jgi:hypothetical protein
MLKMSGWQRQSQNQNRNLRREASTDSLSTLFLPIFVNIRCPKNYGVRFVGRSPTPSAVNLGRPSDGGVGKSFIQEWGFITGPSSFRQQRHSTRTRTMGPAVLLGEGTSTALGKLILSSCRLQAPH